MSSDIKEVPRVHSRWLERFVADPESRNYSRQVSGFMHSHVLPTRVGEPQLLALSPDLARQLGFSEDFCRSEEFLQCMAGNQLLTGSRPYATRYGGHQFGQWAGQLGDGRAMNLGEVTDLDGQPQCLQLKGAGPTPYSRGADGRAVLRSSMREFLCSEAMHFLGVPTTRALSLVGTGDSVLRDMFYDGNPEEEPGAIVCRVAPSFTRFGHFQLCAMRGEWELLRELIDFTIVADFPELHARHLSGELDREALHACWFAEVCQCTRVTLLGWMRTGFVHGVLNTDNMSIIGQTIDYGPYGWLDNFDAQWTPNTTDAGMRRYSFGQQPAVVQWNLYQLANALLPVTGNRESMEAELTRFATLHEREWQEMILAKAGLLPGTEQEDEAILDGLMQILVAQETDYTLFFRRLADFDHRRQDLVLAEIVREAIYDQTAYDEAQQQRINVWATLYAARLEQQDSDWGQRRARMNAMNPCFVLRNYLTQQAVEQAAQGELQLLRDLQQALQRPYDEDPRFALLYGRRPEWARHKAGCSMLSCSS
jgi:uncharacterized protein YdiU (UPF0061 family)